MAPQFSTSSPDLGRTTIICSWTFTLTAMLGMFCQLYYRKLKRVSLGLEDYILLLAFLITIILVVQTTWAIVDEGQGKHIEAETQSQFTKVAHVGALCNNYALSMID